MSYMPNRPINQPIRPALPFTGLAVPHLSNDPKPAVRKLSLPEGLWEWNFKAFPGVLEVFGGSLPLDPPGPPWETPVAWKQ